MARDQFTELLRRMADMERRMNNTVRWARVTEVDTKKGLVKVAYALDPDNKDVISPWLPWQAKAGKNAREWAPPSKNESVLLLSPGGEIGLHSLVAAGTFSDTYPQPHDGEDYLMVHDGVDENGNTDAKKRSYMALHAGGIETSTPGSIEPFTGKEHYIQRQKSTPNFHYDGKPTTVDT